MIYNLHTGIEIIISEIDYNFVRESRQTWCLCKDDYVTRHNKTTEYLHVLIAQRMGLNTDNIIDHENRNTLDNSRPNLRESNPSLNILNSKIRSDNTSDITGVTYNKALGKYYARINGIHLGYFDTKEEAIRVRLLAESKIQW